jgi:hypothetical protein
VALLVAVQPVPDPVPRADEVAALVREIGAREALAALECEPALWEAVVRGVASGQVEWLEVGRELRRYTDPDASEWLDLALAEALLPAPEAVLGIAGGSVWHVDDFCGTIGFAERGASDGDSIARFLDTRREALLGVERADLAQRRDDCLARLSDAREDLLGTPHP